MKIKQLNIRSSAFQCCNIRRDRVPQHHNVWHYHEELEWIVVQHGRGRLFVGDGSHAFRENDVILIGSNIPHYWLFDSVSPRGHHAEPIDCVVTHFRSDFLGNEFIRLHEASFLNELIHSSKFALHSNVAPDHPVKELMTQALERDGILRVTALLEALLAFHRTAPKRLIAPGYQPDNHSIDVKRMNRIMEYVRANFTQKITLDDLAQIAQMTTSSFSRYFKHKTGQTAMQLIVDLRIAYACNLLRDPDYSLTEICFSSGFNNLVSFHKAFKKTKDMTPHTFRKTNLFTQ